MFKKKQDRETVHLKGAGKEPLDDEMLPKRGKPVTQADEGGNVPDTAGTLGEMAPETASTFDEETDKEE